MTQQVKDSSTRNKNRVLKVNMLKRRGERESELLILQGPEIWQQSFNEDAVDFKKICNYAACTL